MHRDLTGRDLASQATASISIAGWGARLTNTRASIAVLGPTRNVCDVARDHAKELVQGLVRGGYGVVAMGNDGVAAMVCEADATVRESGQVTLVVSESPKRRLKDVNYVDAHGRLAQISAMLDICKAVIVVDGDVASLASLFLVWSYGDTLSEPYRQIVLLGDRWREIINALSDAAKLSQREREMVTFVANAKEAVEALRYFVRS